MKIYNNFNNIQLNNKVCLTLGNFDGVHVGHAHILNYLKKSAQPNNLTAVLTFCNHPSQVLKPEHTTPLLCTREHKNKLIEERNIDLLFNIPFTQHLANKSAEEFIDELLKQIPICHLVLGHDAKFGKNRTGDQEQIQAIAKVKGFQVEYLDPIKIDENAVSSSLIRQAILKGDLNLASKLLGRPFSIFSKVTSGSSQGKKIGFPTANFDVSGLCIPPLGVYAVKIKYKNQVINGVANLGFAPTLKSLAHPVLEVHLFNNFHIDDEDVEVTFCQFLRPEQKFESTDQLKNQIAVDVSKAKNLLGIC